MISRFAIMLAIATLLTLALIYTATIAQAQAATPVSQSQFKRLAKKVKRQGEQIRTQEIRLDAYRERLLLLTTTIQYMLYCERFSSGMALYGCASHIGTIFPLTPNPNHLREPLLSLSEIPPLTELP